MVLMDGGPLQVMVLHFFCDRFSFIFRGGLSSSDGNECSYFMLAVFDGFQIICVVWVLSFNERVCFCSGLGATQWPVPSLF